MTEIQDTYFRRLFVPLVVSVLILCGIAAVIVVPPGTNVEWPTSATALGAVKKGGFFKLGKK